MCNIDELEEIFNKNHDPSITDNTGLISKFLDQATPWKKIELSVFATVVNLYKEYEKDSGRIPEYTISYIMNREGTAAKPIIHPYGTLPDL